MSDKDQLEKELREKVAHYQTLTLLRAGLLREIGALTLKAADIDAQVYYSSAASVRERLDDSIVDTLRAILEAAK